MLAKLLIHPDIEVRKQAIDEEIKNLDFKIGESDMLLLNEEEKLGVETAKRIREHLATKAYQSKGKGVIVVDADKLTPEAQNSLLKTLEEPPEESVIILGISSEDRLLTTVLSRCQLIRIDSTSTPTQNTSFNADILELLTWSTEERFSFIEKLEDKEAFFEGLIHYSRLNTQVVGADFLSELLEANKLLNANVNSRAVMEYLMLKLPRL